MPTAPDVFRLTVVYQPKLRSGPKIAETIAQLFDRLGMARDALRTSVPVQIRCVPTTPGGTPRPIPFDRAVINGIVVLSDSSLNRLARKAWKPWFEKIETERQTRGPDLFVLNIAVDRHGHRLPLAAEENTVRAFVGQFGRFEGRTLDHFAIRLLSDVGVLLKTAEVARRTGQIPARVNPESVFLSHASADGKDVAQWLSSYLDDHRATLGVHAFLDTRDLPGGAKHRAYFSKQIETGALLAIHTDRYSTRPYCSWELLEAKRHRRPILAISLLHHGEERRFPYAGNITSRTVRRATAAAVPLWRRWFERASRRRTLEETETDRVVRDLVSELLRCQIFALQAFAATQTPKYQHAIVLLRPPELVDVAYGLAGVPAGAPKVLFVYPDPPLDDSEQKLLATFADRIEFKALSEL